MLNYFEACSATGMADGRPRARRLAARGAVAHRGSLRHFLVCYFSRRRYKRYNRVGWGNAKIIAHIGDPRQT